MIVFKTFLKVLNKCKMPIIIYTAILVFFGAFNMQNSESSINFTQTKPDILIINNDEAVGITQNLAEYITKNSNIKEISDNAEAIEDALFYRDVNYIIYIPQNFRKDFLEGKNPKVKTKSTGDYQASLAQLMLENYLKVANFYNEVEKMQQEVNLGENINVEDTLNIKNDNETQEEKEQKLIENINNTLSQNLEVEMMSKLDTSALNKVALYYNFANYAILAGCIYVVCLILSSFKEEKIKKRTQISSMNYKKHNYKLLLSNSLFAVILWTFYVLISFILLGNIMFSVHGLLYILNSFIFTLCALTIAFAIGNIVGNKNAINGIVNVIALGSSFLCGAFVPMEYLPDFVLKIAHILPSYWYIKTNEVLKTIELFNVDNIKTICINMGILLVFSIAFIIISNIAAKRKNVTI